MVERQSWAGVASLGIVTLTAFGTWFYAFGVLIDPISADEGWSTTALGLTYGAAQILTGVGAFVGGRLLDRCGATAPMSVHATLGAGCMFASSFANDALLFGVLYAIGGGVIGATGFYSLTASAAARLKPRTPDRAIAVLTLIGAFSSPIFIPLTAWLTSAWDWRITVRVLAVLAAAGAVTVVVVVGRDGRAVDSTPSDNPLRTLRHALGRPAIRRMLLGYVAAGIAFASVIVYQVPILTAGGLGLAAAGVIGGLRGLFQIFGRVGLTGAAERFGTGQLLRGAYLLGAAGVALLFIPSVPTGVMYALLAGIGIGAASPLQAMYARSHFAGSDLGMLMGLQGAALGLAGGIGPIAGGALNDLTGSWTPVIVVAIAGLFLAAALLVVEHPHGRTAHRDVRLHAHRSSS